MRRLNYFVIITVLLLLIAVNSHAQQKFALVIGNSNYVGISKLNNPVNDANDMTEALQGLGFTVEKILDGDLDRMESAIQRFTGRLRASRNTYGFFYYAGHGVQANGVNYLIPVNANTIQSDSQLRSRAVSVQDMLDDFNGAGNELNMIVLDACRDNPFSWTRSGSRGLSIVSNSPVGSIVVYATSANSVAADGTGRNGLFTTQLLRNIKTPGLTVREVFDRTGMDVVHASNGVQHPEISVKYFDVAYLGAPPQGAVAPRTTPAPQATPQPAPQPAAQPATRPAQPAPDNPLVGIWEGVIEHGNFEDTYLITLKNGGQCTIAVESYSRSGTQKQSADGRYSFANGMLTIEVRFRDNTIPHLRNIDWKAIINQSADNFAMVIPESNASGAKRVRTVFWKK